LRLFYAFMHNACMPTNYHLASLQAARIKSKALGLRQSDIAAGVGASQSQVSRLLAGEGLERSKLAARICKYVDTAQTGVDPDAARKNDVLMDALAATWDGTETHANALASVIRALGVLNPAASTATKIARQTKGRRK
jgi:transcriptional regulator with XRE-family HTH domain